MLNAEAGEAERGGAVNILSLRGCTFYANSKRSKSNVNRVQIHLVLLAERPELGTHFGWVEAGVRGCWFDSLGVVFKLHICRSLKTRLVLLYEQHRVLQGDTHSSKCWFRMCGFRVIHRCSIKPNLYWIIEAGNNILADICFVT